MKSVQAMTDRQLTDELHITEAKWRAAQMNPASKSALDRMVEYMSELTLELKHRKRHCIWCLIPFGLIRMDGSKIEAKSPSACERCYAENIVKETRRDR
jgi:hypothetical protein